MNFKQKRIIEIAKKCIDYGKYDYVKMAIIKLLKTAANDAEVILEISKLYMFMNMSEKGLIYAKRAFELEKNVETLEGLANANNLCGNYQDAAIFFEELTKYKDNVETYLFCDKAYENLGIETEGLRVMEEGAEKDPKIELVTSIIFRALCLGLEDKVHYWLKVLKEKYPNHYATENLLGFYYEAQINDYEEAKKHFLKSAKMGYINAYYNLGVCCKHCEDFAGSEKYLKKLNSIKKEATDDFNYTLGSIYMAQKKMKLGFKYYSNRIMKSNLTTKQKRSYWDGKDYPNKILYISQEQGFGDNIQFSRFIPYVTKKFKKVYYAVDKSLYDLMKRSFKKYKNIEVIKPDNFVAYHKFVLIMDLQNLLNISYHNIPYQEPYMITDKEKDYETKIKHFRGDGLKIGLNWRAKGMGLRDAVYRTIDAPYYFRKLFDLPDVQYYSLQMNDIFGMLEKYPQINNLEEDIQSFDDTASMIKNMDIVITVDTAIAHLAGALGVKTYLLLCKAPDWRWFDNETKTEWYPNVTIIRQKDRRTWEDVSEKLIEYITEDHKKFKK